MKLFSSLDLLLHDFRRDTNYRNFRDQVSKVIVWISQKEEVYWIRKHMPNLKKLNLFLIEPKLKATNCLRTLLYNIIIWQIEYVISRGILVLKMDCGCRQKHAFPSPGEAIATPIKREYWAVSSKRRDDWKLRFKDHLILTMWYWSHLTVSDLVSSYTKRWW